MADDATDFIEREARKEVLKLVAEKLRDEAYHESSLTERTGLFKALNIVNEKMLEQEER